VELSYFAKKIFGKISLPTASCIDKREMRERAIISYPNSCFVREEKNSFTHEAVL
jgi:hypothetical protein